MLNFIFISPQFPHTYWEFCSRLKSNGVNVLGIADAPYETLDANLKEALTEYYRVDDMEDYQQMFKAVAFLSYKYGKIDWIESNNEYWLEQDARLRTDFNVVTGIMTDRIAFIKEKSEMKRIYLENGIPTARQIKMKAGLPEIIGFCRLCGYPVIAKPDIGVGAGGTHKIHNEEELKAFCDAYPDGDYVIEEFITGDICSYDAIIDSEGNPLFESMTAWPPSIMDIVNKKLDLSYYVAKEMPEALRAIGRKTVKAFRVVNRFVHLEYFVLNADQEGLGRKGDILGLEVNMRPAGGYTPDLFDFANETDVYKIWADMVCFDRSTVPAGRPRHFCGFCGRRDGKNFVLDHTAIMSKYAPNIKMYGRIPDVLSGAMANQMYVANFDTEQELHAFYTDLLAEND